MYPTVPATLPSGFRDTPPQALYKRYYILQTLQKKFQQYGFVPLETPAMEHLTTLLGKYGAEGEQLLFKVLNSGTFWEKISKEDWKNPTVTPLPNLSKKGLRYDLTVPLARYVAQHQHTLHFPFKRYQIQPVWRADRPQKGRYREFYQCDVDVVGDKSVFQEATLLVMAYKVLQTLGISDIMIQLNHRQLLTAIAQEIGMASQTTLLCQILDKTDTLGIPAILDRLQAKGLSAANCNRLKIFFDLPNQPKSALIKLRQQLQENPIALKALDALDKLLRYVQIWHLETYQAITLQPSLARGLSYYTGAIFEIKAEKASLGSIAAGGRYDHLTTMFNLSDMPAVGLSFGLERIYDLMEARKLFHSTNPQITHILLVPMEPAYEIQAISYLATLHQHQIAAELYPAGTRIKKPLTYAHKKQIPWIGILGSKEIDTNRITVKEMDTGQQELCTFASLIQKLSLNI